MRIDVQDIIDGEPIPERFAFAVPDPEQHLRFSDNRNPHVHWHDVPAGTRSLALLVVDVDAPTDPSDVNQEGRSVSADLPRADFYHWVLIDIPVEVSGIDEGEDADGVVAMGKAPGETGKGVRGINSYTDFFIDDEQLEGIYGGYDGPCPRGMTLGYIAITSPSMPWMSRRWGYRASSLAMKCSKPCKGGSWSNPA